jgi:signal transduction histidine kinase
VAERILARGEGGAGGWLESACKGILAFRAGILLMTVAALLGEDGDKALPSAAILVAAVTTAIPLRYWDRVGPTLVRHPGYLAGELVLATLILLMTGVNSPFFYYTLSTALLGGLVYGWPGAALFSVMLIGVYFWVVSVRDEEAATLVMPAFYPFIAAAGAALRGLLDRQAETESELAAQSERTRLARDMHDSLAKTVSGMGFAALGLARRIERDPEGAAEEARRLAEDARQATREAREIIVGLRSDAGEQLPFDAALEVEARRWSETTGVRVELMIEEVGELHPVAARELEWILREALGNVDRHARASAVTVRLRRLGGRAVLTVADDGQGFDVPDELEELARGRHFGVTGMRERAQLAGGDLSVESAPGEGCVLSVWMPAEAPAPVAAPAPAPRAAPVRPAKPRRPQQAPAAEPPAPAEPPDTLPPRSVPGYTWR